MTAEWCENELSGINHEVIIADSWQSGAKKATGELIAFMEKDCVISPDYFYELVGLISEQSAYRKLAMVAPALAANNWSRKVYGYRVEPASLLPTTAAASREPFAVQVAYLPGAILRRSALPSIELLLGGRDPMLTSADLSLYFWRNGNRILLHPGATYCSTDDELDLPYPTKPSWYPIEDLKEMFRREVI